MYLHAYGYCTTCHWVYMLTLYSTQTCARCVESRAWICARLRLCLGAGQFLGWSVPQSSPTWLHLMLPSSGSLQPGKRQKLEFRILFPRMLVATGGSRHRAKGALFAGHRFDLTAELTMVPGQLYPPECLFDGSATAKQLELGEWVRWSLRARDQYGQDRKERTLRYRMRVRLSLSGETVESCLCRPDATLDSCSSKQCCCQEGMDGKYSVAVHPAKVGPYTVRIGFQDSKDATTEATYLTLAGGNSPRLKFRYHYIKTEMLSMSDSCSAHAYSSGGATRKTRGRSNTL